MDLNTILNWLLFAVFIFALVNLYILTWKKTKTGTVFFILVTIFLFAIYGFQENISTENAKTIPKDSSEKNANIIPETSLEDDSGIAPDYESSKSTEKNIDPADAAYFFCRAVMKTNLIISCDVSVNFNRNNSIDLVIDTYVSDAQELCLGLPALLPTRGQFKGEWDLRIISPYSNGIPLAACTLL